MTKDLQQLQQDFQKYLLHADDQIITDVVSDTKSSATTRLNIYQNAFFQRLIEALQQDYPTIALLIGQDAFTHLAQKYIYAHPSTYYSIRWFGEHFPAFLRNESNRLFAENNLAAFWQELATFELALLTAFDAADAPTVTPSQLQEIRAEKWADITFQCHSSLQLIPLHWNVVVAWRARHTANLAKFKPKQYQKQSMWMIWRQEFETYFIKLKSDEALLLQAVMAGQSFGTICEDLGRCKSGNKWITHVAHLLQSWIARGLIVAIR